jgi:hypothetical protein
MQRTVTRGIVTKDQIKTIARRLFQLLRGELRAQTAGSSRAPQGTPPWTKLPAKRADVAAFCHI